MSLLPGTLSSEGGAPLPLMTILSDPARSALYRLLAEEAGLPTVEAEGALHALTQLERMPVAAILCDARMEDMSGEEFRSVVEEEFGDRRVPVHVLPGVAGATQIAEQLPLPTGAQLLSQILGEMGLPPERQPVPLQRGSAAQLHGDLSQFSLPEFLNWVAEMRFSGHWIVTVSTQQGAGVPLTGHLVMREGNLVYAECAGQLGKGALLTLLRCIEDYRDAIFRFYRTPLELPVTASDMTKTTPRLLIELAVELDHSLAQRPARPN